MADEVEWMPIDENTPKDRVIELYRPKAGLGECQRIVHGVWDEEDKAWCWPTGIYDCFDLDGIHERIADGDYFCSLEFTHWRSLKAPPQPEKTEEA